MLNIRTIFIIIICFYLTAPCPRAKRGPVEVNGKGLRQTMDIQWLKLKLIFFIFFYFKSVLNFNYLAMKKKYKHELTNKANTEHEASEKEGNNSGLGLKFKYVTIRCWDLKRIRHKADQICK